MIKKDTPLYGKLYKEYYQTPFDEKHMPFFAADLDDSPI